MRQLGRIQVILLILFFLSGACGLIYEVVWQRMLSLVFGNTTYATTTIVASFMGGMALGSFYFGRFADRYKKPLRLYAYLEVGIGIFAVLLFFIISAMPTIYASLHRYLPTSFYLSSLIKFAVCFLILLIPSFLMGGTLPVISKFFIRRFERLGWGVGSLYGVNTLGGVIGAFTAAFFLLTWLGVKETTYAAATINILIAGVVLGFDRFLASEEAEEKPQPRRKTRATAQPVYPKYISHVVLAVYGLSGFCALAYEVLWTRMLVFPLGSTTHAFATMLTTFLLGLALGSLIFGRFLDKGRHLLVLLAFIEVLIGLSAMLSVWEFGKLWVVLDFLGSIFGGGWGALVGKRFLASLLIMFIPTLLLGIAFPLVNRIYARDLNTLGRGIGNIWSANTLGCIAGSFMAGFVLIPLMGISKSIMVIALINIVLGTVVAFSSLVTSYKVRWAPIVIVVILVVVFASTIVIPSTKLQRLESGEELLYYKEGASATVAVVEKAGIKRLKVNGVSEVPTTYNSLRTFHMLGHLPAMLHRNPQKALIVCFGAGIASGAIAEHDLEQIDVVEISREVVEANNFFLEENQSVLADPRVNLIVDDGRNYLLRTTNQYDVITSDATHPLSGDSWVLYTREFYELAKKRLDSDGIMVQWLPLHMIAPADYKSIVKTFQSVFPDTSLWYTNYYTLLVGAKEELTIDFALLNQRFQDEKIREDLEEFNLGTPFSFLSSFMMGKESVARYTEEAVINTDNYPFLQPTQRRTRVISLPQNLFELEPSLESVFPLLTNMGNEAATIRAEVERYLEAQRHVIRGNKLHSLGMIDREIAAYRLAVAINPEDNNAKYLLEGALDKLEIQEIP